VNYYYAVRTEDDHWDVCQDGGIVISKHCTYAHAVKLLEQR
jgi:hypothetical protein